MARFLIVLTSLIFAHSSFAGDVEIEAASEFMTAEHAKQVTNLATNYFYDNLGDFVTGSIHLRFVKFEIKDSHDYDGQFSAADITGSWTQEVNNKNQFCTTELAVEFDEVVDAKDAECK